MCYHLHSCVCVCVCVCVCINIYMWMCLCVCVSIYLSVSLSIYDYLSVRLSACVSVCPYVHLLLYLINDEKKVMRSWKTSMKFFFKKQFLVLTLSVSPAFHLRFSLFFIYPRKLGHFTGGRATQWMDSLRK